MLAVHLQLKERDMRLNYWPRSIVAIALLLLAACGESPPQSSSSELDADASQATAWTAEELAMQKAAFADNLRGSLGPALGDSLPEQLEAAFSSIETGTTTECSFTRAEISPGSECVVHIASLGEKRYLYACVRLKNGSPACRPYRNMGEADITTLHGSVQQWHKVDRWSGPEEARQ